MSNRQECGIYFREQKELKRLFDEMKRKWQSYGRCAGTVCLKDCSAKERSALGKMLGQTFHEPTVKIKLSQVEEALQETKFAPITVKELLEAYFQEEISTNSDRQREKEKRRETFFRELQEDKAHTETEMVSAWYQTMQAEQKYGYAVLVREYEKNPEAAKMAAGKVRAAIGILHQEQREIPLAVLAAQATGNPHYFDRGSMPGNLFIHGLCFLLKREFPSSAYEWKEILNMSGILPDDVASTVITYRVHLQKDGSFHQGLEAFAQMREPVTLTSVNLIGCDTAFGEQNCAYVVENEMVFRYLYERVKEQKITLLCTSGQMRTAALKLIELLAVGKTTIYYSGDMDPEGLGIAERIWKKYPCSIKLWRMAPADYERGISQEPLEKRSLVQLQKLENPELIETASLMQTLQKAAYQENLLEELLGDLMKGALCS